MPRESAVRIAMVYPEVLGTYGDRGNALVLVRRLRWRAIAAELVTVRAGNPVPAGCDVYLVGGAEDAVLGDVLRHLRRGAALQVALNAGGRVLAVCAGVQLLGESLPGSNGPVPGLGLVPCHTFGPEPPAARAVGTAVVDTRGIDLEPLVGFENHGARTVLADGVEPLGPCLAGQGNGVPDEHGRTVDGVRFGGVLGTYLHGPVLALNAHLADYLLGQVVGRLPELPDDSVDQAGAQARRQRLSAAGLASL